MSSTSPKEWNAARILGLPFQSWDLSQQIQCAFNACTSCLQISKQANMTLYKSWLISILSVTWTICNIMKLLSRRILSGIWKKWQRPRPSAPALELLPFRVSSSGTERDLDRTLAHRSTKTQKGPTGQTRGKNWTKRKWAYLNIVDITRWSSLIWDRIMIVWYTVCRKGDAGQVLVNALSSATPVFFPVSVLFLQ